MILLRKISSFLLVAVIVFSLVSCNKNGDNAQTQTTGTTQEQSTTSPEVEDNSATLAALLRADFPVTDGSTSTNPLDTAIRKAILGEDAEGAWHTTTHESFDNLLEGKCDLILTVKISKEQEKKAEQKGIGIEQYPISKEAFVVVLNKDNPVKSITQQQLKDIYSGKITNWKSLGGPDAEIIAYQRNEDSGSQNYMNAFMEGTKMIDAPTEYRPSSMGGLIDAIAVYDNSLYAIGYSYYSYAAKMYGNADKIKFVAIDGVEVTENNIENDTYPLISRNYAIIRSTEAEKSPARLLVEWICGKDGQQLVKDCGYFPINGKGTLIPIRNIYGTGPEKPKNLEIDCCYTVDERAVIKNMKITGLRSEKLTNDINTALFELREGSCTFFCKNGYLYIHGFTKKTGSASQYGDSVTYIFDLYSGKEITELSDLFYKGTDFFSELTKGYWDETVGYETTNPECDITYAEMGLNAVSEDFYYYSDPSLHVIQYPRDMKEIWNDNVEIRREDFRVIGEKYKRYDNGMAAAFLEYGCGIPDGKVDAINGFLEKKHTTDLDEMLYLLYRQYEVYYAEDDYADFEAYKNALNMDIVEMYVYVVPHSYIEIYTTQSMVISNYVYYDYDTFKILPKDVSGCIPEETEYGTVYLLDYGRGFTDSETDRINDFVSNLVKNNFDTILKCCYDGENGFSEFKDLYYNNLKNADKKQDCKIFVTATKDDSIDLILTNGYYFVKFDYNTLLPV